MTTDPNLKLMATMFAIVADKVVERFGAEGEAVMTEAVRAFGERRGRDIARRVDAAGESRTVENYLDFYDMGRSESFDIDTRTAEGFAEQTFWVCPLWSTWEELGMTGAGSLYCRDIDAALVRGYGGDVEFCHHRHFCEGGDPPHCRMSFTARGESPGV